MEQAILTEKQKQALDYIASESRLSDYYLSGGTALAAYYFGHRISDDLDFFTAEAQDSAFLHAFANRLENKFKVKIGDIFLGGELAKQLKPLIIEE